MFVNVYQCHVRGSLLLFPFFRPPNIFKIFQYVFIIFQSVSHCSITKHENPGIECRQPEYAWLDNQNCPSFNQKNSWNISPPYIDNDIIKINELSCETPVTYGKSWHSKNAWFLLSGINDFHNFTVILAWSRYFAILWILTLILHYFINCSWCSFRGLCTR